MAFSGILAKIPIIAEALAASGFKGLFPIIRRMIGNSP
jgi:hypothetical protein